MAFGIEITRREVQPARPFDKSALLRAVGVVCFLFAAFMALVAVLSFGNQYRRMRDWRPVEATLQSSEIYRTSVRTVKGQSAPSYGVRFTFEYWENGQRRVTVADLGFGSGVRPWMERFQRSLLPGTKRTIRLDPDNPGQASLASGLDSISFAMSYASGGIAMVLLALGCWLLQVSRPRRVPVHTGDFPIA